MSDDTPPTFLDLSVEKKRRVDEVCVAFELAGAAAQIEDYLPRVEPELRNVLLTELVALELERRRTAGEHPAIDAFFTRFADCKAAVRAAFGGTAPAIGGMLGKYRITGVLGRGGMGVVYKAIDSVVGRTVAMKVLPERLSNDPFSHDRLIQEARLAGQLLHPNVVALFEVGEAEGVTFLVLELVTGGSAAERIKKDGALDWRLATRIVLDACRGLIAIHDAGFLHLDIKPGNILLPGSPENPNASTSSTIQAKLTDFSLSVFDSRTATGATSAGTPAYMSPEQRDSGELTQKTDIFGLGAAYFALLTGKAPFPGATVTEVMAEQFRTPTPDPRAINPSIPEAVARVVRKAMATDPAARHASASALLAELEALSRPRRRFVREMLAATVGAILMLGLAAGISYLISSPDSHAVHTISPPPRIDAWEPLLDRHDIKGWHPLVPEGGTPIGAGPRSEFELVELDGNPVLRSNGTGLGGVESDREYENYHLRFEYRWGSAEGDHFASIRYHCGGTLGSKGTHGMELHLQRAGSYLRLNDLLRIDRGEIRDGQVVSIGPAGQRIATLMNTESPVARWNKAALVCVNDWAVHVINGKAVLPLARSRRAEPPDQPLTRGRIRFQSVKGEIYFRKIEIRRVTELPPEFCVPLDGQ